ncbi:MAG: DUF2950 family protein [Planctomycetes bacterium]|nr:DUF2950 family protein [Planctomycetota bacterium]
MSLRFPCECGNSIEAPDSEIGKLTTCPICKIAIPVPTMEELQKLAAAAAPPPASAAAASSKSATKVVRRGSVARKACFHCKEQVPATATVCPFCRGDLTDAKSKSPILKKVSPYALAAVGAGALALVSSMVGIVLLSRLGRSPHYLALLSALTAAALAGIAKLQIAGNNRNKKRKVELSGLPLALGGAAAGGLSLLLSVIVVFFTAVPTSGPEGNQTYAYTALLEIASAERAFLELNPWGGTTRAYWTLDVAGLAMYAPPGGSAVKLLSSSIAAADGSPAIIYASATGPAPYHGYLFRAISLTAKGEQYKRIDAMGYGEPNSNSKAYAFCAYPEKFPDSGVDTYIINEGGEVYFRNTEGRLVDRFPKAEELKDWKRKRN